MLLEGLAEQYGPADPLAEGYVLGTDGTLNFLPLLARLSDMHHAAYGAALFHATLAQGLAAWVEAIAEQGLCDIVLGGGCFLNHVLSRTLRGYLQAARLRVFEASQLPPNDGGLALGQAWIALHEDERDEE
jgi:hydrogenase maturation protein HypF